MILEHEPDPAPVRGHGREVVPGEQHAPRVRPLEPGDHAQQGALAGAARPEDRDHLAFADLERDVRERRRLAEPHGHVLDAQHQNHPALCSRRPRSTRKTETATTTMSTTASA